MTPAQQSHKRAMIERETNPDDLRGWFKAIFHDKERDPFDGERAALIARARSLGLNIKDA